MDELNGWLPDPSGRHQLRHFVDSQPTNWVSDGGWVSDDPMPSNAAPHPLARPEPLAVPTLPGYPAPRDPAAERPEPAT